MMMMVISVGIPHDMFVVWGDGEMMVKSSEKTLCNPVVVMSVLITAG